MALRKPLFMSTEGFSEEMAATDSMALGALTMGGNIDMQLVNKVVNLANPSADGDAANKAYVDGVADEDPIVVAFAPGTRNVTIFTVPTPTGAGRFVLTRCIVRLSLELVGSGNVTFSIGSTSGGVQIIKATMITNATAIGVIGGETIATLGTDMAVANAYEAIYACGQNIYANVSVSGTVTGGQVSIYLYGLFLP